MCELWYNILDKDKKGIIMVKKCFVIQEKVIDALHEKYYISTIENCHFIFLVSVFLVQYNLKRLEMIVSTPMNQIYI